MFRFVVAGIRQQSRLGKTIVTLLDYNLNTLDMLLCSYSYDAYSNSHLKTVSMCVYVTIWLSEIEQRTIIELSFSADISFTQILNAHTNDCVQRLQNLLHLNEF